MALADRTPLALAEAGDGTQRSRRLFRSRAAQPRRLVRNYTGGTPTMLPSHPTGCYFWMRVQASDGTLCSRCLRLSFFA